MAITYIGRTTVYQSTRAYNDATGNDDDWRQSNTFPTITGPCEIALAIMPFHDEAFHKAVFDVALDRPAGAKDVTIGVGIRNQGRVKVLEQLDNPGVYDFDLYIGDVSGVTYPFWLYLWKYPIGESHPVLPLPPDKDQH